MFGIVAMGSGFSGCSFLLCAPPFLQSKNPLFARQKGGFCVSKVWFLKCKKGVFVRQKYGLYKPMVYNQEFSLPVLIF